MKKHFLNALIFLFIILNSCSFDKGKSVRVYEIEEITLIAKGQYDNPYTDALCWVRLQGPGFDKKVYGFWDGGQVFKVRVVATAPGDWKWTSGSDPANDKGLNGKSGSFNAISWTDEEKELNPNRRGFIQSTPNGHALQYADGTPFFFIGDTWWAASTWRYPLTGKSPDQNWVPGPEGISLENLVHYRKKHGYNSVAMIACFPNWAADKYTQAYRDGNGIGIRQAWEKFGHSTAKDMHDEAGNLPFELTGDGPLADYDKINPAFFQSLDKKMDYLNSVGFIPFLETVRRDHGPSWKEYFDWPGSFTRYVQYIASRYGAHNLMFSPLHLDWMPPHFSLNGEEFNSALVAWHDQYGPLPFGQPVNILIIGATHKVLGIGDQVPYLTMHSVGNAPRNHGFYPLLEEQFNLMPPLPTANMEPYYVGWKPHGSTNIAGEVAVYNSDRDNYFGRTQAWGSVFSGGLAGHIYGTGAYDGTTVGEVRGERPTIWEGLSFPAGEQVGYLRIFLESEGSAYQNLQLASHQLHPRKSKDNHPNGLDGWSFMMCTSEKDLAMLYFESKCEIPEIADLEPDSEYELYWFDPITGKWLDTPDKKRTDKLGIIKLEKFPDDLKISSQDWSLKLKLQPV